MGTNLDHRIYAKSDGLPYLSGTEWEYEDAVSVPAGPDVLLYRRSQRVYLAPDDPDFEAKLTQYRRVQDFFARLVNDDGSIQGGFTQYEDPAAFRVRLKSDLEGLIRRHLDARSFAEPLRENLTAIEQRIEVLTREQYRVIRMLRDARRVRITGCAGSGKTLVAVEKAIRLSEAGVRTLLLCHSPLLARHLSELTRGTTVAVRSFCDWIGELAEVTIEQQKSMWTNYDEPDAITLNTAFDLLSKAGGGFDAIIVDEGQDFRPEWWVVVEAALSEPSKSILYIFHDDHQALLPHRAAYPVSEPLIDLSRNCRNAGRIFDLVRRFHLQAPEAELELQDKGELLVVRGDPGEEVRALRTALYGAVSKSLRLDGATVLLCGGLRVDSWSAIESEITVPAHEPWQKGVIHHLEQAMKGYDPRGVTMPPGGRAEVREAFARFGHDALPSPADVSLVQQIAARFGVSREIRRTIEGDPRFRNALRWRSDSGQVRLRRRHPGPLWAAEVVLHFEREEWAESLPEPRRFFLRAGRDHTEPGSLQVFDVSAFKGLESDTVIVIAAGYRPLRMEEIYVAVSRARFALVLVDCGAQIPLPRGADEVLLGATI
jgi:hypothetical protein